MKKHAILHPFLFATYFILNAYTALCNPEAPCKTRLLDMGGPLLLVLAVIFAFIFLLNLILKDNVKSAIIASLLLVPILFYLQLLQFISLCLFGLRQRYGLLIMSFGLIIVLWFVIRTKRRLLRLNSYLNLLGICYVIYGATLVHSAAEKMRPEKMDFSQEILSSAFAPIRTTVESNRDIYYIILDSYPSYDYLLTHWRYDNSSFISELKKRGFYIAGDSRSFSSDTPYSMASTLNITNDRRLLRHDIDTVLEMVKNSVVEKFLISRGYETINLSVFKMSGSRPFYNIFDEDTRSNFKRMFQGTLIARIKQEIIDMNMPDSILLVFFELKKIPALKSGRPRFVYAHIFLPHFPYFFDREGHVIPLLKRRPERDKDAYLDQLIATNKMVIETVDIILTASNQKSIIILQGDHGPRIFENERGQHKSFDILNAYYFPDQKYDTLYNNISPFNTFRVVFNSYFGTKFNHLREDVG